MEDKGRIVVYLSPRHLSSLAAIASVFERSPNTVRKWYKAGAPISLIDGRYSAEYNALQAWCVAQSACPEGVIYPKIRSSFASSR